MRYPTCLYADCPSYLYACEATVVGMEVTALMEFRRSEGLTVLHRIAETFPGRHHLHLQYVYAALLERTPVSSQVSPILVSIVHMYACTDTY